jgi:hypothetical protein
MARKREEQTKEEGENHGGPGIACFTSESEPDEPLQKEGLR